MRKIRVFFLSTLFLFLLLSTTEAKEKKLLLRIYHPDLAELKIPKLRSLDVAGFKRGEWIDIVIKEDEFGFFKGLGFRTEIISPDIETLERKAKGYYHSYPEVVSILQNIASSYPSIAHLDSIGTTYEGRTIYVLKISDEVNTEDPTEPDLLFMGEHHAREWPALEIPLFYADTLTKGYGYDPHITEIVDSREIWIIPTCNPDGHVYCHDQGIDWRKNRHYFPEFGTYGVDLNRNYDGACNGEEGGEWGTIPIWSTSHDPGEEVYCGPLPFSEAETGGIRNLFKAHNFIFTVSYHTYAECVMLPWGYSYYDTVPDNFLIAEIGTEMASRITRQDGLGTYDAYQSSGMYPTTGDSDDWLYGYPFYVAGQNCFAYTVEACNKFQPPEEELDQVLRENFDGALFLCDIADSVQNLLTPRVLPPLISPLDSDPDGDFTISWSVANPEAAPDIYELQELKGLSIITEGGEEGSGLWALNWFNISSNQCHSGTKSFFSNLSIPNGVSTMTLLTGFPVNPGDSLSFWCWHQIKNLYDYAFVEISLQGREWKILDKFTGNSDWVRKSYSLEEFAGKSITIRFRYITDDYLQWEGFYVDDLYPVGSFSSIDTLSNTIPDTLYQVTGRAPGKYWYRVRGHNASRKWGDYSNLEDIEVLTGIEEEKETEFSEGSIPFKLNQSYPNPSSSSTWIQFQVGGRKSIDLKDTELKIYNVSGQLVRTLINETKRPGTYRVCWTGQDESGNPVKSGIYFCRLNSGGEIETEKLVLIR